jgi:hypothetical protein
VAVVAAPTPTPSDPPPGDGGGLPPPPSLPVLPPDPAPIAGASDPAGLFPTVTPSPASAAASGNAAAHHAKARATSAGSTLPLNTRLIGGQLAGLVILAAAIAIAVTRLSFRPQRQDSTRTTTNRRPPRPLTAAPSPARTVREICPAVLGSCR